MEATIAQTLQCSTWIDSEKVIRKQGISVRFSRRMKEEKGYCTLISAHMPRNRISNRSRSVSLEVACSFQNFPASTLEYDRSTAPFDEAFVLKTEVLKKLSMMHQLVISTGGGVVTRPINWKYMQNGVSVWLDVPLEALAQRIAAVGTNSRPLLHQESGNPYTKALKRLTTLWEERGEAYANASARVSLEDLAAKLGQRDVSNLTPATIAVEALEQIGNFLKEEGDMAGAEF